MMHKSLVLGIEGKGWIAYCPDCQEALMERAIPNGEFAEAVGRNHIKDTEHTVIVGYVYSKEAV